MTHLQSAIWNEAKAFITNGDPTNNKEFGNKLEAMIKMLSTVKRMRDEAYSKVKK
jgi:L-fucose isomerase-like protein